MTVDAQSMPESLRSRVSRETQARLEIVVAQLTKWQARINLVSPTTLPHVWDRHVSDSLQLVECAPAAERWLDIGSGGGFPGLVVAAARADHAGFEMTLVESNGKKCAFLRETARLARLPVSVLSERAERVIPAFVGRCDVVSARALAPLAVLLEMTAPLLKAGALGLFPKGLDVDDELSAASVTWQVEADLIQSRTQPGAAVVVVRSATRKGLSA